MVEHFDRILYKCRFIVIAVLIVTVLFLLSVLAGTMSRASAQTIAPTESDGSGISEIFSDDSNAVSAAFAAAVQQTGTALRGTGAAIMDNLQSAGSTLAGSGQAIGRAGSTCGRAASGSILDLGHGLSSGVSGGSRLLVDSAAAMVRAAGGGMIFALSMPGNMLGMLAEAPVVNAAIQPSPPTNVPTIDPNAPIALAGVSIPASVITAQPVAGHAEAAAAVASQDQTPQWPIHGAITTYFGASDWPYQLHHTGIDISDGNRSGVTPVHPFKPGRVIQVIHSSVSLGNHIVIDHGGSMTSVYGHLYSTNVTEGQMVDKTTVLGLEGTTGASTGPHVHFEIRINGQPVNPMQYVPGMP